jgi:hypothetical protein
VNKVYILWWESKDRYWDFASVHSTHESAKDAMEEELASDPDCEYYITPLALKESK